MKSWTYVISYRGKCIFSCFTWNLFYWILELLYRTMASHLHLVDKHMHTTFKLTCLDDKQKKSKIKGKRSKYNIHDTNKS